MQVKVDINKVEIMQTEQVNSGEYNTREIKLDIAQNMQGLILKVLFTKDYKTYEVDIENDSCMIPWEVLKTDGNCELGVYGYSMNGESLELRYSPEPSKFYINAGSYKSDVANGEEPTPTRSEVLEGKIKELDDKKVDKKEGYGLSQNDFTNEDKLKLDNLENYNDTEIKESVENIKNDLTNYYKKSETYNKEEIDNKISKIPKLDIEVVDELPTENISEEVLYLVKSGAESENLYTEYIYVNGKWEKLGEQKLNISHLATKIELENVKTELNAKIEELKTENEQQAEQISYLDKTLARAEASGENINIKNSANYPISKISIDTNIKQDSREGYNKLQITKKGTYSNNGIEATFNNDGSITLNGTSTAQADIIFDTYWGNSSTIIAEMKKDEEYTASLGMDNYISGIGLNLYSFNNGTKEVQLISNTNYKTFTITEDVQLNHAYITVSKGKTLTNAVIRPMLYKGSDVKPFEQYGSMPSIEFPSEIKTPVGKQEVYVGNKNLFDKDNANIVNMYLDTATEKAMTHGASRSILLPCKSNTTYTIYKSTEIEDILMAGTFETTPNHLDIPTTYTQAYGKTSTTITSGKNDNILMVYLCWGETEIVRLSEILDTVQVEYGDIVTTYTPHQSQVQDLDLTSELLGKIYKKDGKWYLSNKYIKILLNEKSTITYFVEQGDYILFQIPAYNVLSKIYCDKLKYQINWGTNYNYESVTKGGSTVTENKLIQIKILSSRLTEISANGILQWLGENNLKVICELATPIEEEITDETLISQLNAIDKMHTYEGVTNIYTINDNGISPVLNLEYVKSPTIIQEDLQNQIDELATMLLEN